MTVYTSIRDYVKRHRTGLLVTATIAGGGYLAGKYATTKIRDIQEKSTADRLAKENLKRRFQQNQNDCVFTVLSLLPTLGDQILHEMNIEEGWAKLQETRRLEKIEMRLRKEREAASLLREEQEALEQLKDDKDETNENNTPSESVIIVEHEAEGTKTKDEIEEAKEEENKAENNVKEETEKPAEEDLNTLKSPEVKKAGELDSSAGSLASSFVAEEDAPLPAGILSKKEKNLLWDEIKIMSFTRTFTSIYSVTLLTMLTHIQLNLLGRFTYIWSVSVLNKSEPTIRLQQEGAEPDAGFLDPQVERMFLSASWWLLHRGWKGLAKRVQEAADEIVSSIPIKGYLNYQDAEDLVEKLRRRIETGEDGKPTSYRSWMLPDNEAEELEFIRGAGFEEDHPEQSTSTISLRKLLDESKDFIDSPDFAQVLKACLDEVFALFGHHAFVKTLLPNSEPVGMSIQEVTNAEALQLEQGKKVILANLLPTISRQAHLVIAGNEYLNAFAYIKELQAFSALIYTQYGEESSST